MARRFQLHESVATALYQTFERWDGHGLPSGMAGEAIALPARVAGVAFAAVMFHDAGGREVAVDALRRWSGRSLDPEIAASFLREIGRAARDCRERGHAWAGCAGRANPAPKQAGARATPLMRSYEDSRFR